MTTAPTEYLPALLHRDSGVTAWERDFCASLTRQIRAGRKISEKQEIALRGIVERFRARVMRDDGVVE